MIRKHEPRVPEGVDVTRPSIARIYDYLLFGKENFAADRTPLKGPTVGAVARLAA